MSHKLQRHQKLGLAALVVFLFSYFLPAYHGESGFACFQVCWGTLLGEGDDFFTGKWFYYSGFAIANVVFPLLVVALLVMSKVRKLRAFVSAVCLLQVVSWPVLHLIIDPSGISTIQIGYYLWLAAFGGLVAAHFAKAPNEAFGQTPVNHHAHMAHN